MGFKLFKLNLLISKGRVNILVFALAALSSSLVAFAVTSNQLPIQEQVRRIVLQIYMLLVSIGWLALVHSADKEERWSFLESLGTIGSFLAPTAAMVYQLNIGTPRVTFWLCLISWIALGFFQVSGEGKRANVFLLFLGTLWTITGVLISVGRLPWLPYARVTESLGFIHLFLDLRIVLGALFFLALTIIATVKILDKSLPEIPSIPFVEVPELDEGFSRILRALLTPFIVIVNYIWYIVMLMIDLVWKGIALIVVFFFRIGHEMSRQILNMLEDGVIPRKIGKVVFTFFLCLLLFYLAVRITPTAFLYLRTDLWDVSVHLLLKLAGSTLIAMLLILSVSSFWLEDKDSLVLVLSSLSIMVLVFLVGGALLYLGAGIDLLQVQGFNKLGLLTLTVLAVVFYGIITAICRRMQKKKQSNRK